MKTKKAFVLNPSQSKRLIAKGIVALPQIQDALENGRIFVARGSTNAYIVEEIFKFQKIQEPFNKADYTMGQVIPGEKFMNWTSNKKPCPEIIFEKGKKIEIEDRAKELGKFKAGDIVLKGATAIDVKGVPGVLLGAPKGGGTIGEICGTIQAKGLELICPVGLEKMIYGDLQEIYPLMGIENCEMSAEGFKCGIMPMPFGTAFTELDALETLFECNAYHVQSGGVGGAEGSVGILIDTEDAEEEAENEMQEIIKFMQEIATEPVYIPNK
jgi:hypothetical protein